MTVQDVIKQIQSRNWYKQGGAIKLFYVFGPYFCVQETIGYDNNIVYQQGLVNTAFFNRDEENAKAKWAFRMQKQNRKFIDLWILDWHKKVGYLHRYCQQAYREPVEKWSDQKLVTFLKKFQELTLNQWKKAILIEWTDPSGMNYLLDEVRRSGIKLSLSEIDILTSTDKLTFVQEEFLSEFEMAKKLKNGQAIEPDLKKHTARFFWYKNTWCYVHDLDEKHFRKEIVRGSKNLKAMAGQALAIKNHVRQIRQKKSRILKNKQIRGEEKKLFYMFAQMAYWRDLRKALSTAIPNSYLWPILKRIMRENRINENLAGVLTYPEIRRWKIPPALVRTLKKRLSRSVYASSKDKKVHWFYGPEAKSIYKKLVSSMKSSEIKGAIANPGIVKGHARLIETRADFYKMKRGDILVAQMTRPEYMPVIRLAGAIVTDEGGVTCHAAIVSRELGIPCIIGTQNATSILKDNDLVEVNANHGWVRRISK